MNYSVLFAVSGLALLCFCWGWCNGYTSRRLEEVKRKEAKVTE